MLCVVASTTTSDSQCVSLGHLQAGIIHSLTLGVQWYGNCLDISAVLRETGVWDERRPLRRFLVCNFLPRDNAVSNEEEEGNFLNVSFHLVQLFQVLAKLFIEF